MQNLRFSEIRELMLGSTGVEHVGQLATRMKSRNRFEGDYRIKTTQRAGQVSCNRKEFLVWNELTQLNVPDKVFVCTTAS
jgi:hypothetical protein